MGNLKDQLKQEPFLPGVLTYMIEASFHTEQDVLNELKRNCEGYLKMENLKGCGELTSQEHKFFNKYRKMVNV